MALAPLYLFLRRGKKYRLLSVYRRLCSSDVFFVGPAGGGNEDEECLGAGTAVHTRQLREGKGHPRVIEGYALSVVVSTRRAISGEGG